MARGAIRSMDYKKVMEPSLVRQLYLINVKK